MQIDIRLLHQLEKIDLHAATRNVSTTFRRFRGDFVNFVDEDYSVFSQLDVPVGNFHKIPHEVLDVVANISSLRKFRGVCLNKRNSDKLGHVPHEVGFAHTGRTEEEQIRFHVFAVR